MNIANFLSIHSLKGGHRPKILFCLAVIGFFLLGDLGIRWISARYMLGVALPYLHSHGYCLPWRLYLVRKDGQSYHFRRGDLIAFHGDARMPEKFQRRVVIKMVVGMEGDRIAIRDGMVWVNGEACDRLWLAEGYDVHKEFLVGEGSYFVLGTSLESLDSRYFGVISRSAVVGPATPFF